MFDTDWFGLVSCAAKEVTKRDTKRIGVTFFSRFSAQRLRPQHVRKDMKQYPRYMAVSSAIISLLLRLFKANRRAIRNSISRNSAAFIRQSHPYHLPGLLLSQTAIAPTNRRSVFPPQVRVPLA
jgi:hypothetical protein